MQYKCIGFNILVNKTFELYMAQTRVFHGQVEGDTVSTKSHGLYRYTPRSDLCTWLGTGPS